MSKKSEEQTLQQKLAELQELAAWFDGDEFSLEAALDKYRQAEQLSVAISSDLAHLKNDIQVLEDDFSRE